MWNADGEVIQIEASAVLYNGPPETVELTQLGAAAATDVPYPLASLKSSDELAAGVVVFLGLEELHGEVASLGQLGPLLQEKHVQICHNGRHGGAGPLLDHALGRAQHGDWQGAIEASSWAYYLARIAGHVETVIVALNIAGSVELHVDVLKATLHLTCAAHLANASSAVADGIVTQVNINAGYALLSLDSPDQAISFFSAAIDRARAHGSEMQLVLACVGGAEAADLLGDHATAAGMLGLCRQITGRQTVDPLPEPVQVIDQSLTLLHRHFSGEAPAHPDMARSWFARLKDALLAFSPAALFGDLMFHLGGGRRSSALISIGATSTTNFEKAVFAAATAIGEHSQILLRHPI